MGAKAAVAPMPTRTATTKVSARTTATFGNNNTALIDLFVGSQDVSDAVGRWVPHMDMGWVVPWVGLSP